MTERTRSTAAGTAQSAGGDRSTQAGFTLVELLVVVIIMGVLAAIAIPTFLGQREAGYRAQAVSDMKNTVTAVETYVAGANGRSYADLDGQTELSTVLPGWGLTTTPWTSLTVSATDTTFCVLGHHDLLVESDLIYSNDEAVVRLGDIGTLTCP